MAESQKEHQGSDDDHNDNPQRFPDTTITLTKLLQDKLKLDSDEQIAQVLPSVDVEGIVEYILSGKCKNVITMAGAGISTSAGIPDFRSPNTGLYHNLQKYNLPDPTCIFTLGFFKENPQPFFTLAKELWPGSFNPTPCHYFIKLLEDKGFLLRHYTQNIDTLERVSGLHPDKLVEAHGTFHTSHCLGCHKEYTQDWIKEKIFQEVVPTCVDCNSVVKPDIVFFGEALPDIFASNALPDMNKCDLLIIMGTSLTVQPFASLVSKVSKTCPRLYINRERSSVDSGPMDSLLALLIGGIQFDFDSEKKYRDVFLEGTCDDGCRLLAEKLGWKSDLEDLINQVPASTKI